MGKVKYLISSFNNIQELVRFTDQKIAALLVICGIQLTFFFEFAKNLEMVFYSTGVISGLLFLTSFAFSGLILAILYLSIFKVLKPAFAKNYDYKDYSCYYFEHIALSNKKVFTKQIKKLDKTQQIKELRDQIFEISKIANRKNKNCSLIMVLLFFSIISLLTFIFLVTLF